MSRKKKILYIINEAYFFVSHKNDLAFRVMNLGHEVHVAVPFDHVWAPKDFGVKQLIQEGYQVHEFSLSRRGQNIVREIVSILQLWRIIWRVKPDILHLITIKPIIYGGIFSFIFRVQRTVFSITGLGQVFVAKGFVADLRRFMVSLFLKLVFKSTSSAVIVQNSSDYSILVDRKIVVKERLNLIKGSGVNLREFPFRDEGQSSKPCVVLASRLLWEKGVAEFVDAARFLSERNVEARFILVGDTQPSNPRSVPAELLRRWSEDGVIEWWGRKENMADVLYESTVVCLPSKYGEGVPKIILEAAASGRPLVVSDSPGCTELVENYKTGLVVPQGDSYSLSVSIEILLKDPSLRKRIAVAAREVVVSEFSIEHVVKKTIALYDIA